ncbi:MAG: fatty acid desaturase, partial [Planctomycetes bacterium]|nr:fatty acid desaturase [Planctomycetota bacterium]
LDWVVVIWMVLMHVGCLAAPFFFSWTALGVCLVLHWFTASIGICLGYHRYLAHRSLKLTKPAKFGILLAGSLSGEGSPLTWAATHRLHHHRSDLEGDPHSPFVGRWWSHMFWLFVGRTTKQREILHRRYVPELYKQPMLRFFEKTQALWLILMGLALVGSGWWLNEWAGAVSMLLWGMCVRMVFAYHGTWLVNSATHLWGYRNYETRDKSKNLWWVAILAYGEGWHNNHHAHPTVAPAGHRWWEVDITWWSIKVLRFFGLATDVNDHIPASNKKPVDPDAEMKVLERETSALAQPVADEISPAYHVEDRAKQSI